MDIKTMREAANAEIKNLLETSQKMAQEYQKIQARIQQLIGKLEALEEAEKGESAHPEADHKKKAGR